MTAVLRKSSGDRSRARNDIPIDVHTSREWGELTSIVISFFIEIKNNDVFCQFGDKFFSTLSLYGS